MKQIKDNLDPIIRKIFQKQHPLLPDIIINWNKIVGGRFSTNTAPWKITVSKEKGKMINILHVQSEAAPMALEMSCQQEIIMERIAVYLGFKAIHSIKVMVYNDNKLALPL